MLEDVRDYPGRGFEWYYWQGQLRRSRTLHGHTHIVRAIAYSPDGTRIATGSDDNTAKIWDVDSGRELLTVEHSAWIRTVDFSPRGDLLLTASDDHTARVWDVATGREVLVIGGHDGWIFSAVFSPDPDGRGNRASTIHVQGTQTCNLARRILA